MLELLWNRKNQEEVETCEHFAYKKSLLLYADECKYCRYARMVRDKASDTRECVCTYEAAMLQSSVG